MRVLFDNYWLLAGTGVWGYHESVFHKICTWYLCTGGYCDYCLITIGYWRDWGYHASVSMRYLVSLHLQLLAGTDEFYLVPEGNCRLLAGTAAFKQFFPLKVYLWYQSSLYWRVLPVYIGHSRVL